MKLSSLLLYFIFIQDTYRRRQIQRTITRQMSFDLTRLLVTEDWFSDISPQTMRRLLNIVSVTGGLRFIYCCLSARPMLSLYCRSTGAFFGLQSVSERLTLSIENQTRGIDFTTQECRLMSNIRKNSFYIRANGSEFHMYILIS